MTILQKVWWFLQEHGSPQSMFLQQFMTRNNINSFKKNLTVWLWKNLDPDPKCDPDPFWPKMLDPDPHW